MGALGDGTYEVVVIDADETPDGVMTLELAVSTGPNRGAVIRLTARGLGRTWVDALGAPGTLTVTNGEPDLAFD